MAQTALAFDTLVNEQLKTTSLCIARHFGKRHDNVIQAIERLDIPESYRALNFQETFRQVPGPNGATRQEQFYELTRDGFALLVMGFTGKKAMEWKIRFLDAFNAMEKALRSGTPNLDRLTAAMGRLSPAALNGLIESLDTPPDTKLARVREYLETSLLDTNLSAAVWDTKKHILNVVKGIEGRPVPLIHTPHAYVESTRKGRK